MADDVDLQPVFPLPNVVLFPRAVLPLHIFEPRYRTMMGDLLDGGQTLVVALLKPGWERDYYGSPEVYPVACVGRVVRHERLADGRYNVMVEGEAKVRIERFERLQPYRIARVRRIAEDVAWGSLAAAQAHARELVELYRRALQSQGTTLDLDPDRRASPEAVVNTIAMNLSSEAEARQQLLEMDELEIRYRVIRALLHDSSRTQGTLDRFRHLHPKDARRN